MDPSCPCWPWVSPFVAPLEPGVAPPVPGSTGGGGGGSAFDVGGAGVAEVDDVGGGGVVVVGSLDGVVVDVEGLVGSVDVLTDGVVGEGEVVEVLVLSSFWSSACFSWSWALPSAVETEPRLASTLFSFATMLHSSSLAGLLSSAAFGS